MAVKHMNEILDKFIGHPGGTPRAKLDAELKEKPGCTPMAAYLSRKTKKAGGLAKLNPNMAVYLEEDIVELLEFLGYPVNFGE